MAVVEEFDNEDGGILLVSGSVVDAADFPCDTSQGLVLAVMKTCNEIINITSIKWVITKVLYRYYLIVYIYYQ